MKIVGRDLHTRYQLIAMLDEETGESSERRLEQESGEAPGGGAPEPALSLVKGFRAFQDPQHARNRGPQTARQSRKTKWNSLKMSFGQAGVQTGIMLISCLLSITLEINRFHVHEAADQVVEPLLLCCVHRVGCRVVDIERSALHVLALDQIHHFACGDRLDSGDVSGLGGDGDLAGLNTPDRNALRVVDGEAAADFRSWRRRLRRNDLGAGSGADEELPVSSHGDTVVIAVGDDDGRGIRDGHAVEVEDGQQPAGGGCSLLPGAGLGRNTSGIRRARQIHGRAD